MENVSLKEIRKLKSCLQLTDERERLIRISASLPRTAPLEAVLHCHGETQNGPFVIGGGGGLSHQNVSLFKIRILLRIIVQRAHNPTHKTHTGIYGIKSPFLITKTSLGLWPIKTLHL